MQIFITTQSTLLKLLNVVLVPITLGTLKSPGSATTFHGFLASYEMNQLSPINREITMKLYHYAAEKHKLLTTKYHRAEVTEKQLQEEQELALTNGRPGAYSKHISFFLEPYPLDFAASVYENHKIWYRGNTLFEHIVETDEFEFTYELVETTEKAILYADPSVSDEKYFKQMEKLKKEKHWIGKNNTEFEIAAKPYIGTLKRSIETVSKLPNFKNFSHKYAALVTHVMLYPDNQVISVDSIKKIIIG